MVLGAWLGGYYSHLLAAVNETLLLGRDAFFLFDALLYALDLLGGEGVLDLVGWWGWLLCCACGVSFSFSIFFCLFLCLYGCEERLGCVLRAYLVVRLNVELDLFAGEGADSIVGAGQLTFRCFYTLVKRWLT